MNCQEMQEAKQYLTKFNQIVTQMGNQMLSCKSVSNITLYFISCMIPHHQAAIYMCENLLSTSKYIPLEEIAQNIIKTQTLGIEKMKQIAKTTCGFCNTEYEMRNYVNKYVIITKEMLERMKEATESCNIPLNFVNEMIPHHEGAIAMCQNVLLYTIDPRLEKVAISIIKEQSEGVKQLKEIRNILCS